MGPGTDTVADGSAGPSTDERSEPEVAITIVPPTAPSAGETMPGGLRPTALPDRSHTSTTAPHVSDGKADHVDVDSDNGGRTDTNEAGANPNKPADTNDNTVADVREEAGRSSTSAQPDSDGDGVSDNIEDTEPKKSNSGGSDQPSGFYDETIKGSNHGDDHGNHGGKGGTAGGVAGDRSSDGTSRLVSSAKDGALVDLATLHETLKAVREKELLRLRTMIDDITERLNATFDDR